MAHNTFCQELRIQGFTPVNLRKISPKMSDTQVQQAAPASISPDRLMSTDQSSPETGSPNMSDISSKDPISSPDSCNEVHHLSDGKHLLENEVANANNTPSSSSDEAIPNTNHKLKMTDMSSPSLSPSPSQIPNEGNLPKNPLKPTRDSSPTPKLPRPPPKTAEGWPSRFSKIVSCNPDRMGMDLKVKSLGMAAMPKKWKAVHQKVEDVDVPLEGTLEEEKEDDLGSEGEVFVVESPVRERGKVEVLSEIEKEVDGF